MNSTYSPIKEHASSFGKLLKNDTKVIKCNSSITLGTIVQLQAKVVVGYQTYLQVF
jgi:hypothetical protein